MPDNLVLGESLLPGSHMDTFLLGAHMVERDLFFPFFFLAVMAGMWDLSSPTRDRTWAPCGGSKDHQGFPRDLFL